MTKTLKDFMEVYRPKSGDEQKFVDKHVVVKHKDRNEVNGKPNGDDVFQATNIKAVDRVKQNKGYNPGDDEKVYEEVEDLDEAMPVTQPTLRGTLGQKVAADQAAQLVKTVGSNYAAQAMRKAVQGAKPMPTSTAQAATFTKEEIEELEESAKIAAHLVKRYGNNVRKSHVVSAAKDFGVDPSKLAKAVRKKLNKTTLDEENDEGWYTHSQMYGSKKTEKHPKGISADEWKAGVRWDHRNNKRINVKEDVDQIDEATQVVYKDYTITGGHRVPGSEAGDIKHSLAHPKKMASLGIDHDDAGDYGETRRLTVRNNKTGETTHHHVYQREWDSGKGKPVVSIRSVGKPQAASEKHHNVISSYLSGRTKLKEEAELEEKTLTSAEMKKREEVVKAIKRGNPDMDKSMAYAIATKTAKRVAEGVVPTADEPTEHDKKMAQKVRDLLAKEKKPVKEAAGDVTVKSKSSADAFAQHTGQAKTNMSAPKDPKTGKTLFQKVTNESVASDDAFDMLDAHGAENIKSHSGGIRYTHNGKEYNLRHHDVKSGHRNVRTSELQSHLKRLKEEAEQIDEVLDTPEKKAKYLIHVTDKGNIFRKPKPASIKGIKDKGSADFAKELAKGGGSLAGIIKANEKAAKRRAIALKVADKYNKQVAKEEAEQIDEISKSTLGSYVKKASGSAAGVAAAAAGQAAITGKASEYDKRALRNRLKGISKATDKLTKEDIINRAITKYMPEEVQTTREERLVKKLEGVNESHVFVLLDLFTSLNEENQVRMLETVETREGINGLIDFALENRG